MMAIKGLVTIFTGAAAKTALILSVKAALAYGVAATITGLFIAGVVVSGITWTEKCVNSLSKGIKALENGETTDAVMYFAHLAFSAGVGADALPDSIHDYLRSVNVSESHAQIIVNATQELQSEIAEKLIELKANRTR
jgi:hypothetical protein